MKFYNIYEKEDVAALALYHLPFYSFASIYYG